MLMLGVVGFNSVVVFYWLVLWKKLKTTGPKDISLSPSWLCLRPAALPSPLWNSVPFLNPRSPKIFWFSKIIHTCDSVRAADKDDCRNSVWNFGSLWAQRKTYGSYFFFCLGQVISTLPWVTMLFRTITCCTCVFNVSHSLKYLSPISVKQRTMCVFRPVFVCVCTFPLGHHLGMLMGPNPLLIA